MNAATGTPATHRKFRQILLLGAVMTTVFLFALPITAPSAWAVSDNMTIKLVQSAKTVVPSYPGLSIDMIGIHPGMPFSQAKAIAAKAYPKPEPTVFTGGLSFPYKGYMAQSHPYVQGLRFGYSNTGNDMDITFTSPATGHRVYSMTRDISLSSNTAKAPLQSTIRAALIKKYGPPSAPPQKVGETENYYWIFGSKGRKSCTYRCRQSNGASAALKNGVVLEIDATMYESERDPTRAASLSLQLYDYWNQNIDMVTATKELKDAAVKLYKSAKTVSAPAL